MTEPDPWDDLRAYTAARLALGRSGASMPTVELLRFGFAHAQARDAVLEELDARSLSKALEADGLASLQVHSAAPDRATYLLRPDLGRRLDEDSAQAVRDAAGQRPAAECDLLLVVGDGLSSLAVERNARELISAIRAGMPADWTLGPVVIALQARVALADEVGELFKARLVAMLIGERPGLSSPDSLGLYLTWKPAIGRHDAERNCISNIRPEGLAPAAAARRFWWLAQEAKRLQLTGVQLKDGSDVEVLAAPPSRAGGPHAHRP